MLVFEYDVLLWAWLPIWGPCVSEAEKCINRCGTLPESAFELTHLCFSFPPYYRPLRLSSRASVCSGLKRAGMAETPLCESLS
ncbi:hypothetical protein QBC46DRAFT_382814 [Diplogelasinospora grovesii]|uniref:Secreted protein n=1 Tax=Diplogelasinospora grovesii TaxID=303347 RepID=A0AAN6N8T7_9PEZI|nr:hypothetical protein QBC46DRAFT_382814 [Diplogelasinospora grovesii]